MFWGLRVANCVMSGISSAVLGFGMYQVHAQAEVTEGGVLGLTLLLEHWLGWSPAVTGALMNLICYAFGWRMLGRRFICYSAVATGGFALSYGFWEQFPPLWPELVNHPLLACVVGAIFVGVTIGFCVRAEGAPTGDDALAMSLAAVMGMKIQWVYLLFDLVVLALSLSYIPWQRMGYSLLTVILSGQLVGLIQRVPRFWLRESSGK